MHPGITTAQNRPLPILVFMWSSSCGLSRRMDSLVDHFMRVHRDRVRLAKVDFDTRPDLARRLKVTETPTLLLLDNLLEVARLEGRQTLPSIRAAFEGLLGVEEDTAVEAIASFTSAS